MDNSRYVSLSPALVYTTLSQIAVRDFSAVYFSRIAPQGGSRARITGNIFAICTLHQRGSGRPAAENQRTRGRADNVAYYFHAFTAPHDRIYMTRHYGLFVTRDDVSCNAQNGVI